MQVESMPPVAARGAYFNTTNGYFSRSSSNSNGSRYTRNSPGVARHARVKKSTPKVSFGEDSSRGDGRGGTAPAKDCTGRSTTISQQRGHQTRSSCHYKTEMAAGGAQSGASHKSRHLHKPAESRPRPPRFSRTDQSSNRRSAHHSSSSNGNSKKSTNGQSKTSKAKAKNTTDCASPAPPLTPPTSSVAETQKEVCEVDSILSEKATADISTIHHKMSSSADSGHFEEFTSSCESGVFDHHNLLASSITGVSERVHHQLCPDTAGSDDIIDEELFLDAYSNLPSEASSVYMTPDYPMSRSPEPERSNNLSSPSSLSDPLSSVHSQEKIRQKLLPLELEAREDSASSSVSTVEDGASPVQERLESCDSHVTILADGGNKSSSSPCSVCFRHASSVFDSEEDGTSESSDQTLHEFRTRQQKRSKDISNMYIGEIELQALSDSDDSAIDFEVKSLSPSLPEEDGDSGCATSIGSPDKMTTSLDLTRPGIFHLPDSLSHEGMRESAMSVDNLNESGVEFHNSFELRTGEHRAREREEKGKDEWPDLSTEEYHTQLPRPPPHADGNVVFPPMGPLPPLIRPPMNGYVHPTPSPPLPPSSSGGNGKAESDPSHWIRAFIRHHQEAVYQHHAVMMGNGFPPPPPLGPPPPIGPPPPPPPMFDGPTGFPGFFPARPFAPPPPPFPQGPGFSALPLHQPGMEPLPPLHPPVHHTLPLSQCSPSSNSNSDDVQASTISLSSPSPSPSPSPVICEKHQLCSTWILWYDKISGSARGQMCDYKKSLNNLSTIDSIEDFWGTYNNIHPPSSLDNNANYHFFKKGIYPLWEDEANKRGGKWVLTIRDDPGLLDKAWLEVLLMVIGGGMEQFDDINGIVVSRRKRGDRIALWTRTRSREASQKVCVELVQSLCFAFGVEGEEAKRFVVELADNFHGVSLAYMHHSDSLKSGASYTNAQHIKLKDLVDIILQSM